MKTFVTVFLKWTKIVLNPWCTKQKIPAYFSYTSIFVWSWQPTFTASPVGNTHIFHIANLKSVQQQSSVQEISNKILGQILLNQIVQKSARDGLLLSCSHGRSCRSAHAGKPKLRGQCDWEAFLWHSNIFEKTSTEICKRTVYKGEMLEMWLRWRMPIRKRSQEHREFHALIASVDLHMWKKCSFSLGGAARPWPMSQWPQCGAGLYGWRRKQKGKQKEDAHGSGFFSDRNLGESWSAEWRKKKGERPAKCTFRSAARHTPGHGTPRPRLALPARPSPPSRPTLVSWPAPWFHLIEGGQGPQAEAHGRSDLPSGRFPNADGADLQDRDGEWQPSLGQGCHSPSIPSFWVPSFSSWSATGAITSRLNLSDPVGFCNEDSFAGGNHKLHGLSITFVRLRFPKCCKWHFLSDIWMWRCVPIWGERRGWCSR